MKKSYSILALLACGVMLSACQQSSQKSTTKSSDKTEQSTTKSSTTSTTSESSSSSSSSTSSSSQSDEELYNSVLTSAVQEYGTTNNQYAFYDIDKNGTDELFIGDGSFAVALYYLHSGTPERLASSYVASSGGARLAFTVYQDGKVSYLNAHSLNGGTVTVYQLKADNSGVDVISEEDFQFGETDETDSEGTELDLTSLNWQTLQSQTQTETTGMDVVAIQARDYTTLVGTWMNGQGETLVFDSNGLVSEYSTTLDKFNDSTIENGVLNLSVASGVSGYMMKLAPAGTIYPAGVDGSSDASDSSRDRIWIGQQAIFSDSNVFYYKVD